MQVKFDICNHPQNFGRIMTLYDLVFVAVLILVSALLISLEVCYIQVKFDIGNHTLNLGQGLVLFGLSFKSWGKIQGKDVSPQ